MMNNSLIQPRWPNFKWAIRELKIYGFTMVVCGLFALLGQAIIGNLGFATSIVWTNHGIVLGWLAFGIALTSLFAGLAVVTVYVSSDWFLTTKSRPFRKIEEELEVLLKESAIRTSENQRLISIVERLEIRLSKQPSGASLDE